MSSHRVVLSVFLAAGLTAASGNVSADADVDAFYNTGKPKLEEAAKLVKEGKFGEAVPVLSAYVKSEPGSADGWNLLAYSQRKLGRFGPALKNYDKALSIDPDHKGAHEYLGELYLQTGKPDLAAKHLAKLKSLCPGGCEEYEDLKKAVDAYAKKKSG